MAKSSCLGAAPKFKLASMEFRIYELPPIGTNAYLLLDTDRKEALLFDAPMNAWTEADKAMRELDCRLSALLLTHGHWDHIIDVAEIAKKGVPVYAHPDDLSLIENPSQMGSYFQPGLKILPGSVDHFIENGQKLSLLGQTIEVRHVPGHSDGSVLFYIKELELAISGDAIFAGGVGRTDLPNGSMDVLSQSIRDNIYSLPDSTVLFPGHGPRTTVGEEMKTNPFVRA